MYEIVYTNRMKRDAKLMKKRGRNLEKLVEVLNLLASGNPLLQKYKDHQLTGNLNDFRECHIESDWLLMYQIFEKNLFFLPQQLVPTPCIANEVLDIIDSYIDIKEVVC